MSTTHSVRMLISVLVCVCALPLPGNLLTGTAAAWVSDPQLFALSGCQLPSMPCTNYWLWINPVLPLARARPRLIVLADHAYTHTQHTQSKRQTGLYVSISEEPTPAWLPPAAQRHNRRQSGLQISRLFTLRSFNVPQMLLCEVQTHTHTSSVTILIPFFYLCPLLIYETDNGRPTVWMTLWVHVTWHDQTSSAMHWDIRALEAFSGNSLLNKCQVLEGVLLSSLVSKQKSRLRSVFSVQCSVCDLRSSSSTSNICKADLFKHFKHDLFASVSLSGFRLLWLRR